MPLPATNEGKAVLYQSLLKKEKLLLLKIPEVRAEASTVIVEMQAAGNNRRVSAVDMGKAVGLMRYGDQSAEELLEISAVKLFQIDKWNRLRDSASGIDSPTSRRWKKIARECSSVRSELIVDMLPVIKSRVLKRFKRNSFDFDHMVNEGVLGVVSAMEKFDATRGAKFREYAKHWIDMRILEIYKKASTVSMSGSGNELKGKIKKTKDRLEMSLGRAVSSAEVANEIGISEDDLDTVMVYVSSLDEPLGEGEEATTLADVIPSNEVDLAPEIDRKMVAVKVEMLVQALSRTEREISIFRIPRDGVGVRSAKHVSPYEAREWVRNWAASSIISQIEKEAAS